MTSDTTIIDHLKPVRFEIDASVLGQAHRATHIVQRQAALSRVEITPLHLKYTTANEDNSFLITSTHEITGCTPEQRAHFWLRSSFFGGMGKYFTGKLTFTFDPTESTLSYYEQGKLGKYHLTNVTAAEPLEIEAIDTPAATIPATQLQNTLRCAAMFVTRAERAAKDNVRFCGISIEGGIAKGGDSFGVSRYTSEYLPAAVVINVPKRNASNLRTAAAKLQGPVQIKSTAQAVHLEADNLEIRCKTDGFLLPSQVNIPFEKKPLASFTVGVVDLLRALSLLSAGLDFVKIAIEREGGHQRLRLRGKSNSSKGHTVLTSPSPLDDVPTEPWPFAIKLEDFWLAASSLKTDHVTLQVTDVGVNLDSKGADHEVRIFLFGHQSRDDQFV